MKVSDEVYFKLADLALKIMDKETDTARCVERFNTILNLAIKHYNNNVELPGVVPNV